MQVIISALKASREYFQAKDPPGSLIVKENLPRGQENAGVGLELQPSNGPMTRFRVCNLQGIIIALKAIKITFRQMVLQIEAKV